MKTYYVYILSSWQGVLYVGVTNDLLRRVIEHKSHTIPGFTRRYQVDRLVYFEETCSVQEALAREKQIKHWRRSKKECLIRSQNPEWHDLASNWSLEV